VTQRGPKPTRIRSAERGTEARCLMCDEWKPIDAFGTYRKGDRAVPQSYCLPCKRAYDRVLHPRKTDQPPTRVVDRVAPDATLPCSKCGRWLPLDRFGIVMGKASRSYKSRCNPCLADDEKRRTMERPPTLTAAQKAAKRERQRRAKAHLRAHMIERRELTPVLVTTIRNHLGVMRAAQEIGCHYSSIVRMQRGEFTPRHRLFERITEVALRIL
jgi:hypothetical protein